MYETEIKGKVVVIGDTHGDYGPAKTLLTHLIKENLIDNRWVVFLGDYVDEGLDTNKLISMLVGFHKYHPQTTFLCGNHDQNLAKALNIVPSPHQEFYWNRIPERNKKVLESYSAANGDELVQRMPDNHRVFLRNLAWLVEHPDYYFVHAGFDPYENFDAQVQLLRQPDPEIFKPKWLYSNTLGYVGNSHQTDKTIVTGHINLRRPIKFDNRFMIDTGAGYGGRLTALLLPEMKCIQF